MSPVLAAPEPVRAPSAVGSTADPVPLSPPWAGPAPGGGLARASVPAGEGAFGSVVGAAELGTARIAELGSAGLEGSVRVVAVPGEDSTGAVLGIAAWTPPEPHEPLPHVVASGEREIRLCAIADDGATAVLAIASAAQADHHDLPRLGIPPPPAVARRDDEGRYPAYRRVRYRTRKPRNGHRGAAESSTMGDRPGADHEPAAAPATVGPWRAFLSATAAIGGVALLTLVPGADLRAVPTPAAHAVGTVSSPAPGVAAVVYTSGEPTVPGLDAGGSRAAADVAPVDVVFTDGLPDGRAAVAIRTALAQIGLPYVWGGDGPDAGDAGFDCSGLTTFSYDAAGITLPRTAHTQYFAGPHVPAGAALQPGDLVFYGTATRVHHVGLYLGAGRMVNAPTFGKPVQVASYRWPGDDYLGATRPAASPTGTGLLSVLPRPAATAPTTPETFDAPRAEPVETFAVASQAEPPAVPATQAATTLDSPSAVPPPQVQPLTEATSPAPVGDSADRGPTTTAAAPSAPPTTAPPTTAPPTTAPPITAPTNVESRVRPPATSTSQTSPPTTQVAAPAVGTVEIDGAPTAITAVGSSGGLPARTGVAGRFLRLPAASASTGSTIVIRLSDGVVRRNTVTGPAVTLDTAAAAAVRGALVLVVPAGDQRWTVWSAS
jgi:cell wall-associated NlpC family hydrolase